jgi:hypothetical protein
VVLDPRDFDFATHRFEHGAQCEFVKREIATRNHDTPEIWAHDHNSWSYGSRAINKGKSPIEQHATEIV